MLIIGTVNTDFAREKTSNEHVSTQNLFPVYLMFAVTDEFRL
jgi:hypothetical protein